MIMCTLQVLSGRMWLVALVLVSAGPNLLSEGEGCSSLQVLFSPLTLSRLLPLRMSAFSVPPVSGAQGTSLQQ